MPTYEYKCPKCNHSVDYMHGMNEKYNFFCPKCKTLMIKQVGQGGHLRFIGDGFYENDYKKKRKERKQHG